VPVRLQLPHHVQQPVSVAVSGSVEANVTALTAFQVGGRVSHVYVEEGQRVTKGQILADLDATDYRNGYNAAAGEADAANAENLKAKAGLRHQELEQAKIDFDRTQDEYQRLKYLYDHQSLPANDFHKIEAAYLASQQRYACRRQASRLRAVERRNRANAGSEEEACRLPVARPDCWIYRNAPNRSRKYSRSRCSGYLCSRS
jgi:multidrug resistance efflux pump